MPPTNSSEAASPTQGGRGATPTSRCRAPTRCVRSQRRGPRAARDVGLHARPRRRVRQRAWSAPTTRTSTAANALRAVRCAFWIGHQPASCAARWAARPAGSAAPGGCVEREERDCVEQRLPAAAAHVRARGRRRPRGRDRRRRRRPRRSASASATPTCSRSPRHDQGILLIKQGRVAEGLAAARRGDGGGHRGRAVADRQRLRLLRRDRGLPGGVRAAPRPGVDRGADAVVRAAARHGQLHAARAWCTAPRSCSCTAPGPTRCRRRGAPASAARWR